LDLDISKWYKPIKFDFKQFFI